MILVACRQTVTQRVRNAEGRTWYSKDLYERGGLLVRRMANGLAANVGIRVPCGWSSACGVAQHALQSIKPHGEQKD
jgi:hypothetical protein